MERAPQFLRSDQGAQRGRTVDQRYVRADGRNIVDNCDRALQLTTDVAHAVSCASRWYRQSATLDRPRAAAPASEGAGPRGMHLVFVGAGLDRTSEVATNVTQTSLSLPQTDRNFSALPTAPAHYIDSEQNKASSGCFDPLRVHVFIAG